MARMETQKPTERKDRDGTVYNHPAFGQISVSRLTGRSPLLLETDKSKPVR